PWLSPTGSHISPVCPGSTPAAPAATRPAPSSAPRGGTVRTDCCATWDEARGEFGQCFGPGGQHEGNALALSTTGGEYIGWKRRLACTTSSFDCRAGKQAKAPVTAQTGPLSGFGPNEWLVQELYESWREDPASVEGS